VARVARRAALLSEDDSRPPPSRVQLGCELLGQPARHPSDLVAAGVWVHPDRVGVVGVVGIAQQPQRTSRGQRLGDQRIRVMPPRPRDARDPEAASGELGSFAGEEPPRLAVDDLVADDPDDAAVVGVQ
jgi:hypothetical protein